jgi:cytosine/adenosine deaminase-related metal-dependent hydrolase
VRSIAPTLARFCQFGDRPIAVGKRADLVVYDLSAPWWVPFNDPVQQLVHAENGSSVDAVLVDGRIVVAGKRAVLFDGEAIRAEGSYPRAC